jgi:hypothetical protein
MKIKIASTALLILAIISLITFMPLAAIWALNTLFTLTIPYTFWTWLAVVVFSVFAKSGITNK